MCHLNSTDEDKPLCITFCVLFVLTPSFTRFIRLARPECFGMCLLKPKFLFFFILSESMGVTRRKKKNKQNKEQKKQSGFFQFAATGQLQSRATYRLASQAVSRFRDWSSRAGFQTVTLPIWWQRNANEMWKKEKKRNEEISKANKVVTATGSYRLSRLNRRRRAGVSNGPKVAF